MPIFQNPAVVIDNGSGMCKSGLAGDNAPISSFPSFVGRQKFQTIKIGMNNKDVYVGQQAQAKRQDLILRYPMEHGLVNNWDDMTKIWHHSFHNQLRVTPSQHPCLLTEAPRNPKISRQRMTEIMFETFDVPAFYLSLAPVLSMYSSGKTTGIVLESGDGVTSIVPINEGYPVPHAIERFNFAGRDLTSYLVRLLNQIGLYYTSSADFDMVRDMKQKCCYVALDFESEMKNYSKSNKPYKLPDGQTLNLDNLTFRCSEALFKPLMIGKQMPGIHQMVYTSILKCNAGIKDDLYGNIVMSGGSTMLPGLPERISKQITALAPSVTKVKVFAPEQRRFLAWLGGSCLASLGTFQDMWISKAQYSQNGSQIVHRKCF